MMLVAAKLTVLLLCVCMCIVCEGCPQNDLYCVGWDVKSTPSFTFVWNNFTDYQSQRNLELSSTF